MMDWFPVVFFTFKVLVVGTGMYFAVKWHYDQGKKRGKWQEEGNEKRAVLRAAGKIAVIFVLALAVLGLVAWFLLKVLGNDLSMP